MEITVEQSLFPRGTYVSAHAPQAVEVPRQNLTEPHAPKVDNINTEGAPASTAYGQTGDEGDDNAIRWDAVFPGQAGNGISVFLLDDPGDQALAVSVDEGVNAVYVQLETAAGVIASTASEVIAAVNGDGDASRYVEASNGGASDGSGLVLATDISTGNGYDSTTDRVPVADDGSLTLELAPGVYVLAGHDDEGPTGRYEFLTIYVDA